MDWDALLRATARFFLTETAHPQGLVADHSGRDSPCSIAGVGFALSCLPVLAQRGLLPVASAQARALAAVRFFAHAPHGPEPHATGYRGFYYHFLDRTTGARVWRCELSSIDTALLQAGMLTAARAFGPGTGSGPHAQELAELTAFCLDRTEWDWLTQRRADGSPGAIGHGWTPERGHLPWAWDGYSEALILYALALGSTTHPPPRESFARMRDGYEWRQGPQGPHLHAAPLFIHQYAHLWLDLRGLRHPELPDFDYAINSQRAAEAQSRYAAANPHGFAGYGPLAWGFTAGDGPGPLTITHRGRALPVDGYRARGAPDGEDDGTIAPWAVAASLPFAPELATRTLAHLLERHPGLWGAQGLVAGVNPTVGWCATRCFAIDQGPVLGMLANHQDETLWALLRGEPRLARGLRAMGLAGAWLGSGPRAPARALPAVAAIA